MELHKEVESSELTELSELTYLRRRNRLFSAILDNAPILISAKDLDGNVMFVSQHFSELEGPSPECFVNKSVYELFPNDIADRLWQNDLKAQRSDVPINAEEEVFHRDGALHTYQTCKFRLTDESEKVIGTCAVSVDITHLKALQHDVNHDPLTRLLNRRFFEHCFQIELDHSARDHSLLTLALLDLDGFKAFNDEFGHVKGDKLLVLLADEIRRAFRRPCDHGFRLGGDEFAVIFSADSKQTAVKMVDDFREAFLGKVASFAPEWVSMSSISAGVLTLAAGEVFSITRAYELADSALYRAKTSGKNCCFSV